MPSNFTCCGCWPAFVCTVQDTTGTGRRYRRAKYNEREYSIEFENLVEEEDFYPPSSHVVTEVERDLLSKGKYRELYQHESTIAEQQDAKLQETEENARLEDEAYIQAKREAARVAKQTMNQVNNINMKKKLDSAEFSKWLTDENIDIDSSELGAEDFESFLEKVSARGSTAASSGAEAFEQTLSRGLAATRIAGDALNALQPVELHAVSDIGSVAETQSLSPLGLSEGIAINSSPILTNVHTNLSHISNNSVNSPIVSQPMSALSEHIFEAESDDGAMLSDLSEAGLSVMSSEAQVSAASWTAVFSTSTSVVAGVEGADVSSSIDPVLAITKKCVTNSSLIVNSSSIEESSLAAKSSPIVAPDGRSVSPLGDEAPPQPQCQPHLPPQPQGEEGKLQPVVEMAEERLSTVNTDVTTYMETITKEITNTTNNNAEVDDANMADPTPAESFNVKVVDPVVNPAVTWMLHHQDSGVALKNSKSGSDDDFCDFDDEFTESSSGIAFEEYLT